MLNFQSLQCGLSLGRFLIGDVDENAAPLLRLVRCPPEGSGTHANPAHFTARQDNSDVADGGLLRLEDLRIAALAVSQIIRVNCRKKVPPGSGEHRRRA